MAHSPPRPTHTAMDTIFIRELAIDTTIGIFDWERCIKQTLYFDIDLSFDIGQAARSDDIEHTLSYKTVAKRVIDLVSNSDYLLVETLIERVAEMIVTEFPVPQVRVTLNKRGAVSAARDVGIRITRTTADYPRTRMA